ncbi:hypothetical protein KIH23_12730 [Flavobacterium sp. CYK-55]|uniref:DUF6607 family protein n=1 Tax=Flavobacterium sp. CYK-55 TaxID=2835529 RepID=UPI001BD0AC9D|nr:DUF6607 family protein [Flavobacterium sp. CYK-55]MBS7788165.1 hypothetical protein [Flavobacterium sp. CYK-55]
MKNSLLMILLLSLTVQAQNTQDQKAIKSMCGCYEIKFNFTETFSYPQDTTHYKPSAVKHETALEWAELIEDEPYRKSIQHLLIVGKGMIVKHWREDWLFENTAFYEYNGFNDWKFKTRTKQNVKGQWTQKVYEVDDKPRYEGTATWVHTDGRTFWQNTTNAPLPRREYTQRSDYNITKRFNGLEMVQKGWIHNQDNDKIIRDKKGNDVLLAQEKGYNTYTKVDDLKCEAAQKWWKENQDFWKKVRTKWNAEFAKNKDLKLLAELDGKPLHIHLQKLASNASQEQINQVIDRFIVAE